MPVDVGWLYENRIIKIRQHGRVTSAQVTAAVEKSREMIRQGVPPVHIISDGTDIDGNIEVALGDLRGMIPTVTEGAGLIVGIHPRAVDRFFSSLGMQIAGVRHKFAKDEREALRTLLEHDPTLIDVIR